MTVEYRVKKIERFIVTRCETSENTGSVVERGIYASADMAYEVAYALCKMEHEKSGEPLDSMNFIYPEHPASVRPA